VEETERKRGGKRGACPPSSHFPPLPLSLFTRGGGEGVWTKKKIYNIQQDNKTRRQQDSKTTRQEDKKTTTRHKKQI
jgi:hypothetical protein